MAAAQKLMLPGGAMDSSVTTWIGLVVAFRSHADLDEPQSHHNT